ncbi:unnamed protein product [Linum trigynum]|uniref:Peptidase M48 domain-containing protein n=1 Tax=Linum trigynum TaxID=586398 RepID=A0AAV2DC56_9ROSI
MASYRRAKLALDAFRSFSSKTTAAAHRLPSIQESVSPIHRTASSIVASNPVKFSASHPYSSLSERFGLGLGSRTLQSSVARRGVVIPNNNPFGGGARRFYYVDPRRAQHFKPRGYRRWFRNPRNVLIVVLVSSGVVITVFFGNLETVPYTKRKHFVLLSSNMEKKMGESQFQELKGSFRGRILPAIHPDSVRVRLIAKDIIEALQRGVSHEQGWKELDYASTADGTDAAAADSGRARETHKMLSEDEGKPETDWGKQDEILDDKWVEKTRKKGRKAGTSHLDGLNWEVVVVDQPVVNAFCLPGGKIVVFTGLLKHFSTDAEIATIIGHEVGHAVARHSAEGITKNLWVAIVQIILFQFIAADLANTMSTLFLRLPFSRKMEIEADYIGLLLMASAGYDPRIAPSVYEKLGKISGESALRNYLSTHPSGKKRSRLLAQAHVMEEALNVYRETLSGREVEGFFL